MGKSLVEIAEELKNSPTKVQLIHVFIENLIDNYSYWQQEEQND